MKEAGPPYKRSLKIIGITLLLYGVLVGTHLGEFWPFSIYPMFSQAGKPWSRAIVRDVTGDDAVSWNRVTVRQLPGLPVALTDYGVDPIDLANFVAKTEVWHEDRVAGLRTMFRADRLGERRLLVFRAGGEIDASDSVHVYYTPYVVLDRSGAQLNPQLRPPE